MYQEMQAIVLTPFIGAQHFWLVRGEENQISELMFCSIQFKLQTGLSRKCPSDCNLLQSGESGLTEVQQAF